MHVGVCIINLRILESRSLKDKRRAIKSVIDRVKNRFNVSIAEVGLQNAFNLQASALYLCLVTNII